MLVLKRKRTTFGKDRRRKRHRWRATVYDGNGETFERLYVNLEKAPVCTAVEEIAHRQENANPAGRLASVWTRLDTKMMTIADDK
jgi:hypothetical protein